MNGKPLPKGKKKPTVTKLKKQLDKLLSEYVRRSYADADGNVQCYTCSWRGHWKSIQNGHLVSRYHLSTRYDLRNCRPQCYVCNCIRNGMTPVYAGKLEQELGVGIVTELYKLANKVTVDFDYIAMIEDYKEKLKNL